MSLILTTNNWKRSFLFLSMIPIVFIGIIYIIYGNVLNSILVDKNSIVYFCKLSNQYSLFKSNIELPLIVRFLGRLSIILLNTTFVLWLCFHIVISYLKLSQQLAYKTELLIELFLISLIYFFIISPSSIVLYILGCIVLLMDLVLILFYWIYEYQIRSNR